MTCGAKLIYHCVDSLPTTPLYHPLRPVVLLKTPLSHMSTNKLSSTEHNTPSPKFEMPPNRLDNLKHTPTIVCDLLCNAVSLPRVPDVVDVPSVGGKVSRVHAVPLLVLFVFPFAVPFAPSIGLLSNDY